MLKSLFLSMVVLACLSFSAYSTERVNDLYKVEIDVSDEGAGSRTQAIQNGLKEVISRVSGRDNADALPQVTEAVNAPTKYVSRYQYRKQGNKSIIEIYYHSSAINSLLQQSRLPVWGEVRPVTVIWLAIQDGDKRYIVNAKSMEDIRKELGRQAKMRGTPIVFPAMDPADRAKVRFGDIAVGFFDNISEASKRYPNEAILLGIMRWTGGDKGWHVKWTYVSKERRKSWEIRGKNKSEVLASGINGNAGLLAQRYAQSSQGVASSNSGSGEQMLITVSNINSIADYAEVNKLLSKSEVISSLQVLTLNNSEVVFAVRAKVGKNGLQQQLATSGTLVVASSPSQNNPIEPPANGEKPLIDDSHENQVNTNSNMIYLRLKQK